MQSGPTVSTGDVSVVAFFSSLGFLIYFLIYLLLLLSEIAYLYLEI